MNLRNILLTTIILIPLIAIPSLGFSAPDVKSPPKEFKKVTPGHRFGKAPSTQAKSCPNGGTLRGGLCHADWDPKNGCPSCCPDKKGSPGSEYCTGDATESVTGKDIGGGRMPPAQMQTPSGR